MLLAFLILMGWSSANAADGSVVDIRRNITLSETDPVYKDFYINSPFPLAIIRQTKNGKWLNANYYDDPILFEMVKGFMINSLKKHISLGLDTSEVFVLGKKNADFIQKLNKEAKLFDSLKTLEHPRYIQQYKSKEKQQYIDKYILALNNPK